MKTFLIILGTACISLNCAGARGKLRMDQINKPVSLSPVVAINQKQYVKGDNLQVVDVIDITHTHWGITYSLISLSGTENVVTSINDTIAKSKGDGVINFNVSAEQCGLNGATGFIIGLLPFMPGCVDARFQGEVVKISGEGK